MEGTGTAHGILSNSVIYCTALYLAAQNGHRDVVKYISELPIVPANDGIFEFTSIYLAAQKGNLDIFKYTFEKVFDDAIESEDMYKIANDQNEEEQANEVDTGESTSQNVVADQFEDVIVCNSIFEAAEIGELSQIKSFVDQGIDINVEDENGFAPLHIAAKAGKAKCVKLLIEYGANIEYQNTKNYEKTAIDIACENNHLDVALVLINNGANVEAPAGNRLTPLYYAAKSGSETIVRLLLNKGADINAIDYTGYPMLSEAHNKNILNIFLEIGYDFKRITYGGTILHAAARYDNAVLAEFIFEKQINVNIHEKDNRSKTAIILAAEYNSCNVMKILLRNGANIQDLHHSGYNVLHTATYWNKYEAVKLLLKNSANVNELTKKCKRSSLILAVRGNNLEIIRLLLSYKADVKIEDVNGLTALNYAKREYNLAIVKILSPYY